jgi:hypothetical protein
MVDPAPLPTEAVAGRWHLVSADIDGDVIVPDEPISLALDGDEVIANMGCSNVFAEAEADARAATIRFRILGETLLGCPKAIEPIAVGPGGHGAP